MFKGLKRFIGNIFWSVVEELYEVHKHREMAKKRQSMEGSTAINPNDVSTDKEFEIAVARGIEMLEETSAHCVSADNENPFDSLELELMKIESKEMVENLLLTMDLHLG